ncbi:nucleoside deaminase [Flexithrix dorotheae]|uniref:nucleoside deaminase n=1 Tax=Flexithrix dorotheae TaxID=70993 RepID=UPI00037D7FB9|nr:nucleoside deaminase [Flexithrix dorotheae]
MFNDEYFMREALKEARKAYDENEIPVGAVVVCQNRIVGRGHNQSIALNDATAHAEMVALSSASNYLNSRYLKECTLYVTLEPCVMCAGASFWAQLGEIVFGAADSKNGFSKHSKSYLHPATLIKGGVLENECLGLIQSFFKNLRENKNSTK